MKLNIKLNKGFQYVAIALATFVVACQPDELGHGNGLTTTDLDAGFIITKVADANNTYLLTANSSYITSSWDIDNGAGFYSGGTSEEVFYPDAGTYSVKHKVTGIGGIAETFTQTIDVETSDPVAGNLVRGGKFLDASDHSEWTILNISGSGAIWTFNTGSATIVASGWNQQGIYQAIEVIAGKEYKIDMIVSGDGNNETWFEVFASTVEPVQWNDYANNVVMGLNTWAGCGIGTFSGSLSSVGCVDNSYSSSRSNTVTFDTSGTIYLVIKCGGSTTPGITITNVEMRGTN
ncbi:PKD domain-containing protein [Flaviramulus sp. BrNp1-15]|uniref:PKD domain-containing protein n=1 Tax=Flaviramulus sp. BrNp1-15 TaxID=2916754 RepID=UPI001EE984F2|nr:PKD domain-containing protein [Flaviramulus sp. BrNp1-15]ULC58013.1 PKD domain-containing protein [Flaviramulus sp. BrNp1-15]